MSFYLLLTVLCAYFVLAANADLKNIDDGIPHDLDTEQTLIDFMLATSDFQLSDPGRSIECFNSYLPQLNNKSLQYKTDFSACLSNAYTRHSKIDNSSYALRYDIVDNGKNACALLESCSKQNSSVGYFGCLTTVAKKNVPLMNEISDKAADILAEIEEQYNLIGFEQKQCIVESKRTYKANTIATFDDLQKCLSGSESDTPKTTTAVID